MQVQATVIRAGQIPQETQAILRGTIAGSDNLVVTSRRSRPVDSGNRAGRVFAPVISDIHAHNWRSGTRLRTFYQYNLRNFAIFPEVLGGPEGRNELVNKY